MLNILDHSVTSKQWLLRQVDVSKIEYLSKVYSLDSILSTILINRGISTHDTLSFINPKLKTLMPDPYTLYGLDKAIKAIIDSIRNNKKILLFSDYDVDGISSLTLLSKYFQSHNIKFSYYIPSRFQEGYGLNSKSLLSIEKYNADLVILLDNGSSSYDQIKTLEKKGTRVIIVDHHALDFDVPPATAIINPKYVADTSGLDYLCTVGILFLLLVALNRSLLDNNLIHSSINLIQYLDIVVLGTVADVVPLIGINRAYASLGLQLLQKRKNIGISCLLDIIKINGPINFDTIGFYIAPLINSASRMGLDTLSYELLNENDYNKAFLLATNLYELNQQRQIEEEKVIHNAVDEIESNNNLKDEPIIILGSEKWSLGTLGIIAGRIKEIYNKPTCIFAIDTKNNTGTASGRSIEGIDLGEIILGAKSRNLLLKGGGHSQAVGFSFDMNNYLELKDYLYKQTKKKLHNNHVNSQLIIDTIIPINILTIEFVNKLNKLSPFGSHFSEPVFLLQNVRITNIKQIGNNLNHISCFISDGFKFYLKAFCFKALPGILGETLLKSNNQFVDLVVTVKDNFYMGKSYVNLIIKDFRYK